MPRPFPTSMAAVFPVQPPAGGINAREESKTAKEALDKKCGHKNIIQGDSIHIFLTPRGDASAPNAVKKIYYYYFSPR